MGCYLVIKDCLYKKKSDIKKVRYLARSKKMRKLKFLMSVNMILLICIGLFSMESVAKADLIPLTVNDTYTVVGEFDSSHVGLERRFDYEVTNDFSETPTPIMGTFYESMTQFEISAGSDQGVS